MKNKYLILQGMILVVVFLIGFFATSLLLEPKLVNPGTIYLKPDEIQYAPGLKEKTGATIIVIGLLGETFDSMVPTVNVEDIN